MAAETGGLYAAILAVQGEAPTLPKDKTATVPTKKGGEYSYSYTALDTIVEKIEPLLHKNGLVWLAKPSWRADLGPSLKYKLAHAPTGEVEADEMPLMLAEDADAQALGSAITYMRRYALVSVLNLVADTDDDGALAKASGGARNGSSRPASEKQLALVKKLLKEKRVPAAGIRVLLVDAGVANTENVVEAVDGLSGHHASSIIDRLMNGPAPTGESDVPSDPGDFKREPVEDDGTLPFSPEIPA